MDFNMYVPTKILFGAGTLNELGKQQLPGKKAVIIISNGKSTRANGYLSRTEEQLAQASVATSLFDKIQPNPLKETVMEGAAFVKAQDADFIVALGGGSEADAGCVITNPETNEKVGLKTPDLFPVLCIEDPELMKSVPAHYTAYQGFDALSHSLEGYISKFANLMSDMYAITAIENVGRYLARAVKNGNDIEARTHVAFGNILSGTVMCVGTTSSQHSLEHALSAYHPNLPHGAGLIMLSRAYFGNVIAHHACDERFIRMAKAMGMENADKPEDFLTVLQKLLEDCGVADLKMSDYGITPDEFPKMADNAMGPMGGLFACDRVALTKEDVIGIYQKSYK